MEPWCADCSKRTALIELPPGTWETTAKTIRLYAEAVAGCAATRMLGKAGWEQAGRRDVRSG